MRERLADDAVLRTSNEAGRARIDGADAIVAHLARPGPGEVGVWDAQEWPTGVALTFEWTGARRHRPAALVRPHARRRPRRRAVERGRAPGRRRRATPRAAARGAPRAGSAPRASSRWPTAATRAPRCCAPPAPDGDALVLKRVAPGADWLARATHDAGARRACTPPGAFDAMPEAIDHGIVAVAARRRRRLGRHARRPARSCCRPTRGCRATQSRRCSTPPPRCTRRSAAAFPDGAASAARPPRDVLAGGGGRRASGPDLLPKQFEHGWEAFADVVPADVADPCSPSRATRRRWPTRCSPPTAPPTLIHGDLRDDNLGFDGDRVVLIDWDLATAGTPTVDFAWYLAQDAWRIDATHDELEADHRAAQGDALADDELELGLLSGLVQYGWLLAHSARVHPDPAETAWGREELDWWVPRVRRGLERLGGAPGAGAGWARERTARRSA